MMVNQMTKEQLQSVEALNQSAKNLTEHSDQLVHGVERFQI